MRRVFLFLAVTLLLAGCSPADTSSTQKLEGCTIGQVFTCTVDRAADGRSFTLTLHNTASIPVVDVSATVSDASCTLRNDTRTIDRLNAGADGDVLFECTSIVPPSLQGNIAIAYTLASGYAGEPSRVTEGDFIAYKR